MYKRQQPCLTADFVGNQRFFVLLKALEKLREGGFKSGKLYAERETSKKEGIKMCIRDRYTAGTKTGE